MSGDCMMVIEPRQIGDNLVLSPPYQIPLVLSSSRDGAPQNQGMLPKGLYSSKDVLLTYASNEFGSVTRNVDLTPTPNRIQFWRDKARGLPKNPAPTWL